MQKTADTKVRAKKALGQHFLTDQRVARAIVDALEIPGRASLARNDYKEAQNDYKGARNDYKGARNDYKEARNDYKEARNDSPSSFRTEPEGRRSGISNSVLEIGPGMGVLTQYLLERPEIDLKLVELDGESVEYLLTHFRGMQGRLWQADYLKLDVHRMFPGEYCIIGNFPYNISSQIFFKILDDKDRVPQVVCMIQKEVAERIAEKPGSKTYGILSVLLQAWYDIEYLFTVGPGAFAPPPKVQSAVIRLRRNGRTDLGCDEALFKKLVKTAFGQRRKTLRNALKVMMPEGFDASDPVFDLRAEKLSVEDFVALTRLFQ